MGNAEHAPQQRVWTRNLFLIFASSLLFFNALSLLPLGAYHVRSYLQPDNHDSFSEYFTSITSLESASVEQLHGGEEIATVLKAAAEVLGAVSAEYHLDSLQALSNDLHKLAAESNRVNGGNNLQSRASLLDPFGLADAFKRAGAGGAAGGAAATGGGGGITGIISSLGGKLLNVTADALAGPAEYLGDGVGRGATTGLKINNGVKQTAAKPPSGINKVADNLGFGLSNALTGSLNVSSFGGNLGAAGAALGSGLGGGTASGLGLNKSAVVAPNGTGVAGIAGGLGNGLTNSLFSNLDISKLMPSGLPTGMIQSAIVNAAKGLGEGAAEGLNLPMNMSPNNMRKRAAAGMNSTAGGLDINKVAFGFTKSLSSSFLGAVDIQKIASQAMGGGSNLTAGLATMVGPTIVGAAGGLGSGAAQGLGLQNAVAVSPTGPNTAAPEVAHNAAFELTTSFLANGTLQSLQTKLMSVMSMSTTNITSMLGPAAQGAGSGIGQGVAVGLGLQDQNTAQAPMGGDVAMVSRDFTFGLTSNFLANGTVEKLQAKATSLLGANSSMGGVMSALKGVEVSKAAEGLARGLVDGAGQSVANMGGFQAILNGANATEVMMQAATPIFMSANFNDTTGGVATSFGQGLGGQGVTVLAQMLGKSMSMSPDGKLTPASSEMQPAAAPMAPSEAPMAPMTNLSTRARSYNSSSVIRRTVPGKPGFPDLSERVDTPAINISEISNDLISGVNVTSLDVLLQKGVDTLTCQGIGGLVQIFQGLQASGSIPSSFLMSGKSVMLPNATFTIESQDNKFTVNPANIEILVNGVTITRLIILIVVHAFVLILAYFVAIPLALLLTNGNEIATMLGRPQIWAKASRFRFIIWCVLVMPLSILGVVLGVVLLGSASHGKSLHGIIGFITIVLTFVAFILEMRFTPSILALRVPRGVVLLLVFAVTNLAFVTGFVDVQRISLCTVQLPDALLLVVAMVVTTSFATGTTVVTVKMFVKMWLGKERTGTMGGDTRYAVEEKSGFDE